jgi:hypothetical protein
VGCSLALAREIPGPDLTFITSAPSPPSAPRSPLSQKQPRRPLSRRPRVLRAQSLLRVPSPEAPPAAGLGPFCSPSQPSPLADPASAPATTPSPPLRPAPPLSLPALLSAPSVGLRRAPPQTWSCLLPGSPFRLPPSARGVVARCPSFASLPGDDTTLVSATSLLAGSTSKYMSASPC